MYVIRKDTYMSQSIKVHQHSDYVQTTSKSQSSRHGNTKLNYVTMFLFLNGPKTMYHRDKSDHGKSGDKWNPLNSWILPSRVRITMKNHCDGDNI